jgi:hypothetical protein
MRLPLPGACCCNSMKGKHVHIFKNTTRIHRKNRLLCSFGMTQMEFRKMSKNASTAGNYLRLKDSREHYLMTTKPETSFRMHLVIPTSRHTIAAIIRQCDVTIFGFVTSSHAADSTWTLTKSTRGRDAAVLLLASNLGYSRFATT